MRQNYLKQLASWFLRIGALTLCVLTVMLFLSGCTTQTIVKPQEPKQVPTALTEKSTPLAESFSQKVSTFSQKVLNWLEGLQVKKTH